MTLLNFSFFLHDVGDIVVQETQQSKQKRVFLDNIQRKIISEVLVNSCTDGKLNHGIVKRLASFYSVSIDVIYRIWKQIKETGDACHKKTKNCGRKRVEIDLEKIRDVPLGNRSTLRSLAFALGIKSKTTVEKLVKEGILRRHSSTLKPYIKDDNKKDRLRFCLSMLEENNIPHNPIFKSMYNIIHIDEKWFEMTKKSTNYYLVADEEDPYRTCRNKNYIPKVMFLVAIAGPRFDEDFNVTFTGKIGVFPLVQKVPARRSSVNRVAVTLETKPITSITKKLVECSL
jgi:transposase